MTGSRLRILFCLCLLLALSACGNKGPLYLPEDDPKKKTQTTNS